MTRDSGFSFYWVLEQVLYLEAEAAGVRSSPSLTERWRESRMIASRTWQHFGPLVPYAL